MTLRPDDLPHDFPAGEVEGLRAISQRLDDARPYPGAAFRSRLRAGLFASQTASGRLSLRPAYGLIGSALLLVAGLGPLGVGPFAA